MPDFDQILQTKNRLRERLFAIPGVHCIGIGPKKTGGQYTNEHSLQVFVTRKRPLDELNPGERIPAEIDGVKLDVLESPIPRLHDADESRYPSLRGGIQIMSGGDSRGQGTLGFIAQSTDGQKIYAVTNQHVLLISQNRVAVLDRTVQPEGLTSSPVKLTFKTQALQTIMPRTIVGVKIIRQRADDTTKFEHFDVVYATVDSDTDVKVAQQISQLIQDLNIVQVTPPGTSRIITISASPGFLKVQVECGTFGAKITENAGLTVDVVDGVIEFSGQAADPGGAFVNVNPAGAIGTYGVFVPVAEGDDANAAATNTVAAVNALISSTRIAGVLSGITVSRTGPKVTITGASEIECEITKDDRVGHPSNSFCCRHHKCCSDRIGRVVSVAMDLDAALIQLDGEQQYIAMVEEIPENGGRVSGTRDIKPEEVKPPDFVQVQKRGRSTKLTKGKITTLEAEGIISHTSEAFPNPSWFHRYYKHAMRIDSLTNAEFSDSGDSGSALMDHNNNIVGLVFGGGGATSQQPPHGLATPIHPVLDAFQAFNLVVATTTDATKPVTVPGQSFNFAALPERHAVFPIVGGTPLWEGVARAEAEIGAVPAGREISEAVRRHVNEGFQLVTTNRRVGAVWKRNGGQQIFPALLRLLQNPASHLPEQIGGRPLAECLMNIRRIFERYGSPGFVADLRQWGDQVIGLMSLSYDEMLSTLESTHQPT